MRRILVLATIALVFLAFQAVLNCSSPLENVGQGSSRVPDPLLDTIIDTLIIADSTDEIDTVIVIDTIAGDTVYIIDTTVHVDTIVVIDTIIESDTLVVVDTVDHTDTIIDTDTIIQTDTVWMYDTVIVTVPDTSGSPVMCSRLGANQHEIVWLFRNAAGSYRLEFAGLAEREHPSNVVKVLIDGQEYLWDVWNSPEFIVEQELNANATIFIERTKPNPYGHALDICVTVSKL